jgi:hypothetical protein
VREPDGFGRVFDLGPGGVGAAMAIAEKNKSIVELRQWAADPVRVQRFEALALLCQRTTFVKTLLGLTDRDAAVRRQLQTVCARHGVECTLARGPGYDGLHLRWASMLQRYSCSFLLGSLLAGSDGGIEENEDGLDPDNLVDRMIYSYRRYLDVRKTSVANADVSFEMFHALYRAYSLGDIDLLTCENCGSAYVQLRTAHVSQCPLCGVHHHAVIPANYRPALGSAIDKGQVG